MARYRTRRPSETMQRALQPLIELRASQDYAEGGNDVAETASIIAFDTEVALHSLGGARRIPRRFQEQLYAQAQAQMAEEAISYASE